MRTEARQIAGRLGHIGWLSGALMLTMATNDDGSCNSIPDAGEAECHDASDCGGLPHIDCAGSWGCDDGACVWTCGQSPQCQSDADCKDDQSCKNGVCRDDEQPTGCFSSEECKEGQHCDVEDGVCHRPPGCEADQACPTVCFGECVDNETKPPVCTSDRDCADGEYCGCAPWEADPAGLIACDLRCLPKDPNPCNADQDCANGEVCVNGQCQAAASDCYSDDQCKDGYRCDFSNCWDANGAAPQEDPSGDGDAQRPAPACPGQCVPEEQTTCNDGSLCPRGTHCEEQCMGVCPPCACDDPNGDCACPACEQECKSTCVPDAATGCQDDSQCEDGYYCGGCGETPALPNGIAVCERQCLPKENQFCHNDWECNAGQVCEIIACTDADGGVPDPDCDPSSGEDCAEKRPEPPGSCWGYCHDVDTYCSSDAECKDGYYCDFSCGTNTDPADGAEGDRIACPGVCTPKENPGECTSDRDCVSADGQQGSCVTVCEASDADFAMPCYDADGDGACDEQPPGGGCKSYCEYPPTDCNPWDPSTCPDGTHCESSCGGFMPNGLVVNCPYQCVPDQKQCDSNCACGYGEQCVEGVCQAVDTFACDDNFACPEGYMCGCPAHPGFGIACFPQCVPERPACCSNADCGDGNQCVDGACSPWYCEDGKCPDGYVCQNPWEAAPANGLIIAPPSVCVPAPDACSSDCDCDSWESCINGECQVGNDLNQCYGQCSVDSDCGPGQYCKIEEWTACDANGAGFAPCPVVGRGICVDSPTPTPCGDGQECPDGETCECRPDPSCPQCDVCLFQCVPKDPPSDECKSDADCPEGTACIAHYPPCACPVDADGNWGPCPGCEPKNWCEPIEPPVDPGACKSDADCGEGQKCDLGACPSFMPCAPDASGSCGGCTGTCVEDTGPTSCVVSGCSGQICAAESMASTCEWRDWYACYKLAKCEEQADTGSCGWTPNDEFRKCLEEHGGMSSAE